MHNIQKSSVNLNDNLELCPMNIYHSRCSNKRLISIIQLAKHVMLFSTLYNLIILKDV